ncbi:hypothetical protein [Desulfovulcanus sp.]
MSLNFTGLIYLFVGIATIFLFVDKRKKLPNLTHELVPELSEEDFQQLKINLKMAYERILFLGVSFLLLAFFNFHNSGQEVKTFFIILLVFIFFYNIPPRNRVMRILNNNNLNQKILQERGFRL